MDVTLDEVAVAAGVGVGTVYRRFSNKHELIAEVVADHLDRIREYADTAARDPDPWRGLAGLLDRSCGLVVENRVLGAAMTGLPEGAATVDGFEADIRPLIEGVLARAQQAGTVRPDVTVADMFGMVVMVNAMAAFTEPVEPGGWRRYLTLLLMGIRADRDICRPLGPPLTMDQLQRARAITVANRITGERPT
ncbi:TetR/AcrR family transcriptional regulator [Nocardia sp. BSTN01]|nr:TetR/AcrR family transcriptional regulator [Nocardia sp. BSTN01]